jgi:hypothetical protein
MGLLDVLNQYQQRPNRPPPQVFEDFDQVSREAAPEDIEFGLEEAFNSDDTPPPEQMIGQLYERSDDHTRAGLLNEILASLGAGAAAGGVGGGALGGLLRRMGQGQGNRISPQQARDISRPEVEAATAQAVQQNPSIIQAASRFYARHPQLVQNLGQAALAILMSGMARRRRM